MTEIDAYGHGSSYEIFIRRAFNCDLGQHGAENSYFKFLLMADLGKNYLSKPYNKQLEQVKSYLVKAIDKYLKRKPTQTESAFLEDMKGNVLDAHLASDIVPFIEAGLEVTRRYKDL